MKPEDKIKVCAELDEYTDLANAYHGNYATACLSKPVASLYGIKNGVLSQCPDYLNDLNVILPLIKKRCDTIQLCAVFEYELGKIVGWPVLLFEVLELTAEQFVDTLIRAEGLWKD